MPRSSGGQCWFLFPVAIILLAGGCAALVLLGLPAVRHYTATRHFRSSVCQTISVHYIGNRSCGLASSSSYPCVVVVVLFDSNSEVDGNITVYNPNNAAVLYQTIDDATATGTWDNNGDDNGNFTAGTLSRCSIHACSQSSTSENAADVQSFVTATGFEQSPSVAGVESTSQNAVRKCYVDLSQWDTGDDQPVFNQSSGLRPHRRRAFVDVVSGDRVVHTLWWPLLAIGSGLFFFIVAVFQVCYEAQSCRRRCCCCCNEQRSYHHRQHPTATNRPVVDRLQPSLLGISRSASTGSASERLTMTTGTSSSSSGTNSSRRSKSSTSNRSLLPSSATSTARSTKSTAAYDKKTRRDAVESKFYESNTV